MPNYLVLSRKKEERIIIGDNITICVIEIRGDKVRLGIDCPRDITVHREEVYQAIQREQSRKPPIPADASCDVRGLAGAGKTQAEIQREIDQWIEDNKAEQPPEDDQPLLDKMEDEHNASDN